MCKPKIPEVTTLPDAPKKGTDAPDLATPDEELDELTAAGRLGLDRLRIDKTSPSSRVSATGAGVQS